MSVSSKLHAQRCECGAGTYLEMILAYVEGAVWLKRVYLQGPEANMCLRAFSYPGMKSAPFDLSAWLTGGERQNAR